LFLIKGGHIVLVRVGAAGTTPVRLDLVQDREIRPLFGLGVRRRRNAAAGVDCGQSERRWLSLLMWFQAQS
jgi:hypothetical protein